MATKRGKKPIRHTTEAKPTKTARPAGGRAHTAAPARKTTEPLTSTLRARPAEPARPRPAASATPRPAPSGPSLLDRAVRLRDAVQTSKLTAADPWAYTAKARGWSQEAQAIVDEIARGSGSTDALVRRLDALTASVEGDRDYQEARRRA